MTPNSLNTDSVRLAVFDCDGTLVDSQHSIVAAMGASFRTKNFPAPDAASVRRVVGLPLLDAVEHLAPDLPAQTHEDLRDGYRDAFLALRKSGQVQEPLFPGTVEGLDILESTGWLLGVATGKARQGLDATLDTHGLGNRFVTMQTADIALGKPHPEMLYNAMSETGADRSLTVMIGDTTYDMEMARNAGTCAIGVAWGYHDPEELLAAGAHVIIHDYSELPEAMETVLEAAP